MFYALRYLPDVGMRDRKHVHTLPNGSGRFATWVEADDARVNSPVADLLEVVEREPRESVSA